MERDEAEVSMSQSEREFLCLSMTHLEPCLCLCREF